MTKKEITWAWLWLPYSMLFFVLGYVWAMTKLSFEMGYKELTDE